MNSIKQRRIIIEYFVWEPFEKLVTEEESHIIADMKDKTMLKHAGYSKIRFEDVKTSYKGDNQ